MMATINRSQKSELTVRALGKSGRQDEITFECKVILQSAMEIRYLVA